jgi:hypothetical protein
VLRINYRAVWLSLPVGQRKEIFGMKYSLSILKLYLSKFGDQDSREDSNAILSKATAFPLDPQKFSKKAAQEVSLGPCGSDLNY